MPGQLVTFDYKSYDLRTDFTFLQCYLDHIAIN